MNRQIEIDLDVHKVIENNRINFEETPNEVLRRIFGISKLKEIIIEKNSINENFVVNKPLYAASMKMPSSSENFDIAEFQEKVLQRRFSVSTAKDWIYGRAHLPEGAKLRKWYGRQMIEAIIKDSAIFYNGKAYQSPSAAGMAVTGGSNVNGWIFWEYFNDKTNKWEKLDNLRKA